MVRVFRDAGYETARHLEYGEISLEFAMDETGVTENGDARARAARGSALDQATALPAFRRGGRGEQRRGQGRPRGLRQPAADELRGADLPDQSRGRPCATACRRIRRCSTCPARSTWSSWPCPPQPSPMWSPNARRAVCVDWSCSAAVSESAATMTNGRTGPPHSAPWSVRRARTGCAWSGRTAWASSTPIVDRATQRVAGAAATVGRTSRFLRAVRRARRRDPGRGGAPRHRSVDVRIGRQPRRRLGQRPAAVLGDRRAHRRRADVSRVVRQSAQVRATGPSARAAQADRRGEQRRRHVRRRARCDRGRHDR